MNKKGFTLVELLAVIVVLAIILAIAIPGISGIIKSSTMGAMESDAKLVLKSIDLAKLGNDSFNPTDVNQTNIKEKLRISSDKYQSLNISILDGITYITIVGQGKWAGYTACGSYQKMQVREGTCELDFVAPVITLTDGDTTLVSLGGTYTEPGATALDKVDGDLTSSIIITGTVDTNTAGTYAITYSVSDSMGNTATKSRTVLVVKTDVTFGGTLGDYAQGVIQTSDGGYAIVGYTNSSDGDITDGNNGGTDVLVLKLSVALQTEWNKTYGGSGNDYGSSIVQTSDGGYIIIGSTNSIDGDITDGNNGSDDVLVIKTNASGIIEWNKTYGGSGNDRGNSIISTSDGGYAITGESYSNDKDITDGNNGSSDIVILKTNALGVIEWNKTYGGTSYEAGYSIIQTSDGGYVIAGSTQSSNGDITDGNNGSSDIVILKTNALGVIEWNKTYGGSSVDSPGRVIETSDGGFVVVAQTASNGGDVTDGNNGEYDCLVLKLTSTGTLSWNKTYGGSGDDRSLWLIQTSDGGYAAVGFTNSSNYDITDGNNGGNDVLLIKLTSTGTLSWNKTYGGSGWEAGYEIIQTSDGGYLLIGSTASNDGDITDGNNGDRDVLIIKVDANGVK